MGNRGMTRLHAFAKPLLYVIVLSSRSKLLPRIGCKLLHLCSRAGLVRNYPKLQPILTKCLLTIIRLELLQLDTDQPGSSPMAPPTPLVMHCDKQLTLKSDPPRTPCNCNLSQRKSLGPAIQVGISTSRYLSSNLDQECPAYAQDPLSRHISLRRTIYLESFRSFARTRSFD